MYSRSFSCAFIGSTHTPFLHELAQSAPDLHAEPQGHRPPLHAPWQPASLVQVFPHSCGKVSPCSLASWTWKSLKRTRPHCNCGGFFVRSSTRFTGVLKVKWRGVCSPV